ncbi:MAG: hypothetical protein CM1200mP16_02290 [Nitrospina sp.]|nr:MAG: hypothetical protein CM1200mP16_02290 [Nitrospina sp.]
MENIDIIPYPTIAIAIFIFGLVVGSFANVCIHRLPKKESIVFPVSHCISCSAPVRPFDNIPVISYLILVVNVGIVKRIYPQCILSLK